MRTKQTGQVMPGIRINGIKTEIEQGSTILKAAEKLGINIPTLCFKEGFNPSATCMVCSVLDNTSGKIVASCSTLALEGMDIVTQNEEIDELRKTSVELLLSEHLGDCEAPCQRACPAHLDIPVMNRHIALGDFEKALETILKTIPLPAVLGFICPAPCEKVCRRKTLDSPVSVCMLKRSMGLMPDMDIYKKFTTKSSGTNKIAVVGAGPAGLSLSFYLQSYGFDLTIFEKSSMPGGMLQNNPEINALPREILNSEIQNILSTGISINLNTQIGTKEFQELCSSYKGIVFTVNQPEIENLKEIQFQKEIGAWETYIYAGVLVWVRKKGVKPKMAVQSVFHGRFAAECFNQYFNNQEIIGIPQGFNSSFSNFGIEEALQYLSRNGNKSGRNLIETRTSFSPREAMLEANRCLHCECFKLQTCKLKSIAEKFGAKQSRFKIIDRKKIERIFYSDTLVFEPQKCIKCGVCVQISEKSKTKGGFTILGRGFDAKIGIPIGFTMDEAMGDFVSQAIECCPTGALS